MELYIVVCFLVCIAMLGIVDTGKKHPIITSAIFTIVCVSIWLLLKYAFKLVVVVILLLLFIGNNKKEKEIN